MSHVLIHGNDAPLSAVEFRVYGPYETVALAQGSAERLRTSLGLPAEATPENNDLWTDAGHWFGIVPLVDAIAPEIVQTVPHPVRAEHRPCAAKCGKPIQPDQLYIARDVPFHIGCAPKENA